MIPALTPVPTTSSTATRDFVNIKVSPPPAPVHARAPLDHVLTHFCLLSGTPWNGATTSDLLELVAIDGLASNGMPLPNCYPIPQPTPQAQTAAASTAPLLQSPPARVDPLTFLLHRVGRRNVCDAGAKRLPCEASRRRLRARRAASGPAGGTGLDSVSKLACGPDAGPRRAVPPSPLLPVCCSAHCFVGRFGSAVVAWSGTWSHV